jgi:hypothetical protein
LILTTPVELAVPQRAFETKPAVMRGANVR